MPHLRLFAVLGISLTLCSSQSVSAASVLQNLPPDSLAFIAVNKLSATDAKVEQMLQTFGIPFPGPLAFLNAAAGVGEGIDRDGDLLFAVLPAASEIDAKLRFALWLPVADYDRFLASLTAERGQQITAVAVASEEILVAQHGTWALVMDTTERKQMQRILSAEPSPPNAIANLEDWFTQQEVVAGALSGGIRGTLQWALAARPASQRHRFGRFHPAESEEDLFGADAVHDPDDTFATEAEPPPDFAAMIRPSLFKWATASRQLTNLLVRSELIACGLRFDEHQNLHASLRVGGLRLVPPHTLQGEADLPTLYEGGSFVLHGAGRLPPPLVSILAGAYVRRTIDELKSTEGMTFREPAVAQFQQAVEKASAGIVSAAILSQPGDDTPGIYTNDFLVVRTAAASRFAANARDVMRLWNTINRDALAQMRMVFDVEESKFGDRDATQYLLDVAAADGAAEIPEVRQAMEQFFGPGGKLRLWIVPIDDEIVLLAVGTPEQVAEAVETLDRKQATDWSSGEIADINALLPTDAYWRLFFNPRHYNTWYRRQMDAMTGPVLGGPIVQEFPPAPAVGFAGGLRENQLWIDAAIPAATVQATAEFLKK